MTWFAASVLIAMRTVEMNEGPIQVYENVVLMEAGTTEEALEIARQEADGVVKLDDNLTIDGKPATRSFVGIRKLITIRNPGGLDPDQDPPNTGTELTYSLFEVQTESDLLSLGQGNPVNVTYLE